jgi:RND superfamily putative drug exporter
VERLLQRLGLAAARRPGRVIAAWVGALALAGGAYGLWHGALTEGFDVPGLESSRAVEQLAEELPSYAGATGTVVLRSEDGQPFTDRQRQAVAQAASAAADLPDVAQVVDPFAAEAERAAAAEVLAQGAEQLDQGRAALAEGQSQLDASAAQLDAAQAELDAAAQAPPDPAILADPAAAAAAAARAEAAQAGIDEGRAQLEASQDELDLSAADLSAAQAELDQGEALMAAAAPLRQVSADGAVALVAISFTEPRLDLASSSKRAAIEHFQQAGLDGIEVAASVELSQDVPDVLGWGEAAGLALAALVLTIMFRALAPMLIPVVGAVTGVGVAVLAALACSDAVAMSSITPILAVMLGLAVGVDYSLFIIYRHRRHLLEGLPAQQAAARANGSAGAAVVFAGGTVIVALAALNIVGIPFLGLMGTIGAVAIAAAVAVAVTLTPAILGLAGSRALPRRLRPSADGQAPTVLGSAGSRALPRRSRHSADGAGEVAAPAKPEAARGWGTGRCLAQAAVAVVVLLGLAVPALSLRLGLPDGSSEPAGSLAGRADGIVREAFGAGANGPLLVTAALPAGLDASAQLAAQTEIALELAGQAGVEGAAPVAVAESGELAAFQVLPASGPNEEATEDLVRQLRDFKPAGAAAGTSLGVAGQAAINIDMSARLRDALAPYLLLVVLLSLAILVVVFRSLVVPLIAAGGFILSLFATLGAVVATFQWGWGEAALRLNQPGPVLNFLPILLVGLLFGLAMDYQIFLASGMREAHLAGAAPRAAVAQGLASGRPVVVAAGLIMVVIFGGFVLSDSAMVKSVGFALAFGVIADAFLVRLVLMPALVALAGRAAWWLPAWLGPRSRP